MTLSFFFSNNSTVKQHIFFQVKWFSLCECPRVCMCALVYVCVLLWESQFLGRLIRSLGVPKERGVCNSEGGEKGKGFFFSSTFPSLQFSSVAKSCPTLSDPMKHSTPGLPAHHQLPEFTQTHIHRVSDAIQPFHPLSSPSPPAYNPSHHQSHFQWVTSSHEVAKVLEFQP